MTMQVCFVNTDDMPIEVRHVCFYTKSDGEKITLIEVVQEKYPHPEAKDDAVIWLTTERNICTVQTTAERGAIPLLLQHAQNAAMQFKRVLKQ